MPETQVISLGFNVLLSLVAFFGGAMLRDLSSAVKELRSADKELAEKIGILGRQAITSEEMRDLRGEMRDGFKRIHDRIDEIGKTYVTRDECRYKHVGGQ